MHTTCSIVPDVFACFQHTQALNVSNLLRPPYRLEQVHSRHSTQAVC